MKLRAVNQTGGEDIVAGYEPEGETLDERQKDSDNQRLSWSVVVLTMVKHLSEI